MAASAGAARRRRAAAPASSTCRPGGRPRSWPSAWWRPGIAAAHYHGGMATGPRTRRHEEFLADGSRSWWPRRRSAWASTRPTSAGWRTWRCPTRPTATCRRSAGPDATGGPPGRCCCSGPRTWRCSATSAAARRPRSRSATSSRCSGSGRTPGPSCARSAGSAPASSPSCVSLLEEVGAVVDRPRRQAPQSRERAAAGRGGPTRARRGGATPDGAAHPHRHDARSSPRAGRCRGQALLTYFGDTADGPCGHCDNCARPVDAEPAGQRRIAGRANSPAGPVAIPDPPPAAKATRRDSAAVSPRTARSGTPPGVRARSSATPTTR